MESLPTELRAFIKTLDFTHPEMLRLLYLIPVLWLIALWGMIRARRRARLSGGRVFRILFASVLRSLALAAVVFVLAGLARVREREENGSLVYLMDASDSLSPAEKVWLQDYVRDLDAKVDPEVKRGVIFFASGPQIALRPGDPISRERENQQIESVADLLSLALPPKTEDGLDQPTDSKSRTQGRGLTINTDRTDISSGILSLLAIAPVNVAPEDEQEQGAENLTKVQNLHKVTVKDVIRRLIALLFPEQAPSEEEFDLLSRPGVYKGEPDEEVQVAQPKKIALLLSDGNENAGNAMKIAERAREEGVVVHAAAPPREYKKEVFISKLRTEPQVRVGDAAQVKAVVVNEKSESVPAKLRLYLDDDLVREWEVDLSPGTNVYQAPYEMKHEGFFEFRAELEFDPIEDGTRTIESDRAGQSSPKLPAPIRQTRVSSINVVGKPKILIVSGVANFEAEAGAPGPGGFLAEALKDKAVDVRVIGPSRLPRSFLKLMAYDCIVFDNVSEREVSLRQMELIKTYVRDFGGGFVMVGGESSFGQSGFQDTPIEEILPVNIEGAEPYEIEKKTRLSIVIIIDRSNSMKGKKMVLARQSAIALVKQLDDNDLLGVIAFDVRPYLMVTLQPIAENRDNIIDSIKMISHGGGTDMYYALVMALNQLVASQSQVNHVILLTDGATRDRDYWGLINALRDRDITVSTIAIGWLANIELLDQIARGTGGQAYTLVDNIWRLPKLVIEDSQKAVEQATFIEEFFVPKVLIDSEILGGIDQKHIPPLRGYCITTPKRKAEVPLITDIRDYIDPILANWRYGLGKTVAYTSDANAHWSAKWLKWKDFNKFWKQVVKWAMREESSSEYRLHVKKDGAKTTLAIESFAFDPKSLYDSRMGAASSSKFNTSRPSENDYRLSVRLLKAPQASKPGGSVRGRSAPSLRSRTGFRKRLIPDAYLSDPSLAKELLLKKTGPREYRADISGFPPGKYRAIVGRIRSRGVSLAEAGSENQSNWLDVKVKGVVVPRPEYSQDSPIPRANGDEFPPKGVVESHEEKINEELLRKLAETTGGKFHPDADDLTPAKWTIKEKEPLTKYLLPLAMCLFLLDVAVRKFGRS